MSSRILNLARCQIFVRPSYQQQNSIHCLPNRQLGALDVNMMAKRKTYDPAKK
jgi:hypothetical protein